MSRVCLGKFRQDIREIRLERGIRALHDDDKTCKDKKYESERL